MEINLSPALAGWLHHQIQGGASANDIRDHLLKNQVGSEGDIDRLCAMLDDRGEKLGQAIARYRMDLRHVPSQVATPPDAAIARDGFEPVYRFPFDVNAIHCDDLEIAVVLRVESPHAVVLDGLLTADECRQLIDSSKDRLQRALVVDGENGGSKLDDRRTSELVSYQRGETDLISRLERRIERLTGIPADHGEGLQVMRYGPGAEYQPHFDHFDLSESGQAAHLARGGQRVATLVMYLADVGAGGATIFPEAGVSVQPGRGRALYFAYTNESGECNPRAFHGGAPVITGEKWIATKWFRQGVYC